MRFQVLSQNSHLFEVDKVIFAHGQFPADGIYFVLLKVSGFAQAVSHLMEGYHALTLNLVEGLRLSFLLYELH